MLVPASGTAGSEVHRRLRPSSGTRLGPAPGKGARRRYSAWCRCPSHSALVTSGGSLPLKGFLDNLLCVEDEVNYVTCMFIGWVWEDPGRTPPGVGGVHR